MYRTILVTKVIDKNSGVSKEIYGRYDAVKLANDGMKIISAKKKKFIMSDSDFAKYGTLVES